MRLSTLQLIPTDSLMKKDTTVALTFLQRFKELLDEKKGGKYHALEARKGQSLGPGGYWHTHTHRCYTVIAHGFWLSFF